MKSKYFLLSELVPHSIKLIDTSWTFFDSRFIQTIDSIKELFGYRMICNTWAFKSDLRAVYGNFEYRGYRPKGCGVGAPSGAHYKGMAADFDFYNAKNVKIPSKTIIDILLKNRSKLPFLIGIETGVNWNHIDVMDGKASSSRVGVPKGKIILFDDKNNARIV